MASKKDIVSDKDRFSIITPKLNVCYICGSTSKVALHEVFFGNANRSKSKEDGMVIGLCAQHHNMSNFGVHNNRDLDLKLKKQAEKIWISKYTEQSNDRDSRIKEFITRYGKNWLDESDEV